MDIISLPGNAPLIVTLQLEEQHQQFFNLLRKEYFPAHANYIDAHITLFHNLPSTESSIKEKLKYFANHTEINLLVSGIRNIGNGVVYTIESEELQQMHRSMQKAFKPWLIRKDRQRLCPHITIQNKVTAYKAQVLQQKLAASFTPFEIKATGISTWLYLKGPWKAVENFTFNRYDIQF